MTEPSSTQPNPKVTLAEALGVIVNLNEASFDGRERNRNTEALRWTLSALREVEEGDTDELPYTVPGFAAHLLRLIFGELSADLPKDEGPETGDGDQKFDPTADPADPTPPSPATLVHTTGTPVQIHGTSLLCTTLSDAAARAYAGLRWPLIYLYVDGDRGRRLYDVKITQNASETSTLTAHMPNPDGLGGRYETATFEIHKGS